MSYDERYTHARHLLTSAGLKLFPQEEDFPKTVAYEDPVPYASAVSNLYSSKLLAKSNEELAESNDKHANRMTGLTCALVFFAIVEAVATAVSAYSALVAAGIIGP
jgi:hypothetical protein